MVSGFLGVWDSFVYWFVDRRSIGIMDRLLDQINFRLSMVMVWFWLICGLDIFFVF